jgi:TonB family protein
MANKERFGKFILLEEIESSGLGAEYRAAKLGSGGLEKIVTVLRLGQAFSAHGEIAKGLMEQAKVAAQLQTPNILKILGIGKVEGTYYISYEFVEGKSLRAIFSRCRQESFPLSVDHALLIASKICSALEYAHSRKVEGAGRYYHGFLTPGNVVVSYEGELRVRGFGYWLARIRDAGGVSEDDLLYLAPEQVTDQGAETRSDIFAVGAILFEALTGQPLFQGGRTGDIFGRLARARLLNPTGDDDAIPRPIADILARSLAADPGGRYAEVQELRKGIDTLLFSGDFTPTTFNLAFFMHSLFRDDIERESKALKQEREASYFEYLGDESAKLPVPAVTPLPAPVVVPAPAAVPPPPIVAHPAIAVPPAPPAPANALPLIPPPPPRSVTPVSPRVPTPPRPFVPPPLSPAPRTAHTPVPPPATLEVPVFQEEPLAAARAPITISTHEPPARPREPVATGPILSHALPRSKSRVGLFAVAAVVLVAVAGGGYYFLKVRPSANTPAPNTVTPQMAAILEEKRKLQEQLDAVKREQEAAIAKAVEEETKKKEEEAKRKGQQVDPAALKRAQEEAAKKAAADGARKAQEEQERLEKLKADEDAKLAAAAAAEAERQRQVAEAAAQTPVPTPTPAPTPPPTPGTYAADDPNVVAPTAQCPQVVYPQAALQLHISGVVRLFVSIDETGKITEIRALGGPEVLRQPAIEHYRKCKFRPPTTKDGRPIRVNRVVNVNYTLQ